MLIENSLYENVTSPHYARGAGSLVVKGNVYRNTRGHRDTLGAATFDPAKFYKYTLDKAEDLPGILAKYAGPQENIRVGPAPLPAVKPKGKVRPGLRYRYYEAPMQRCGDMAGKKPVREGVIATPTLDIDGRRADEFGVVYEGFIKVPEDELYTFSIASDDGSVLWLDGEKVVDNDGLHARVERPQGEQSQRHLAAAGKEEAVVAGGRSLSRGGVDVEAAHHRDLYRAGRDVPGGCAVRREGRVPHLPGAQGVQGQGRQPRHTGQPHGDRPGQNAKEQERSTAPPRAYWVLPG